MGTKAGGDLPSVGTVSVLIGGCSLVQRLYTLLSYQLGPTNCLMNTIS